MNKDYDYRQIKLYWAKKAETEIEEGFLPEVAESRKTREPESKKIFYF